MKRYTGEPLVARNVSMRDRERERDRTQHRSEMNARRVDKPTQEYNQSVDAAADTYMKSALQKVRQSDVTHDEDLLRLNGTWTWNRK